MFEVEVTDEFTAWFGGLAARDRARVTEVIDLLERRDLVFVGPSPAS